MCCSMKNLICTRNTAQHSFTARADYFRPVQRQTCINLNKQPFMTTREFVVVWAETGRTAGSWLWCHAIVRPAAWSSLGGVSAPSISKCRTRNRLGFICGAGEQSAQVLRRGAAKTQTKVLFKDERHKRRNFKQVSRFSIRFLGFFFFQKQTLNFQSF